MSTKTTVLAVTLLVLVVAAVAVDPALAAHKAGSTNAGEGLGKMLQGWAKWLIPGTVAVVGIPAVARHDFGMTISIVLVAMLIGAFAFMSADGFDKLVAPVLRSITGA
jgi:hypothetical protein